MEYQPKLEVKVLCELLEKSNHPLMLEALARIHELQGQKARLQTEIYQMQYHFEDEVTRQVELELEYRRDSEW